MPVPTPTPNELAAKQAIIEVIHRYCRAMDRMDAELALSCWHEGGTDDHAPLFAGTARGFIDWLWPVHAAMEVTRHVVSNVLIDLNGDKAGAESYWTVTLRVKKDGQIYDIVGGGRYVDNFECIDGQWAIRHRQSLHDWDVVQKVEATMATVEPMLVPNNPEVAPKVSSRDRTDYSYSVIAKICGTSE
jgi:hypothetical protein